MVKILPIVLATMALSAIILCTAVWGAWMKSDDYVHFDKKRLIDKFALLKILDDAGNAINEPALGGKYKQISLADLHDYTYMAFVAVEDKRFFHHGAIDCKRIVGAAISNAKSGSYKEGASTISQQLIKNTHLSGNKTLKRKMNEILLAHQLEETYSKYEILEMYLNTIYFGRNAYGIECAAEEYFGKHAKNLTIGESALLVGMVKAPNSYAPDKDIAKCTARRKVVLSTMLQEKVINQSEYKQALHEEITCKQRTSEGTTYASMAIAEACKLLNIKESKLYESNYVIETYCNAAAQKLMANAAKKHVVTCTDGTEANFTSVLCNNYGGVQAFWAKGEKCASRQVGSILKPIAVYTPAMCENLICPASPVLDEETNFNGYKPCNAGKYYGWTTVKNSVVKSLNVPAVKTLNMMTLPVCEKYLSKLGFEGRQDMSVALGNVNGGMDALDVAKCYCTLANGGLANNVAFVSRITKNSKEVYSRKTQNERVFDEQSTYLMTDMLASTAKMGTAKKLRGLNCAVAAKTGTVGNAKGNSDAIVAGYTTSRTFVAWYFGKLPNEINGGSAPCEFALDYLGNFDDEKGEFAEPSGIVRCTIDQKALTKEQKLIYNPAGDAFLFSSKNIPISKNEKYCNLTITRYDEYVKIKLPPAMENCKWVLYKNSSGEYCEICTNYGFSVQLADDSVYKAKLYDSKGKIIGSTTEKSGLDADNEVVSAIEFWQ